jgi:small-conductance mechanosensitive channel
MFESLRVAMSEAPVPRVAYLVLVLLGGALLLQLALRTLREGALWRLQRLRKKDIEDPVRAQTEHTEEAPRLEDVAARSIEKQFTVTRQLVRPLVVGATVLLALVPFLDQVPAATLSLVVGVVTVLLGIAARPVVENAISGLVISFSRTLNLGDTVKVDGHYGTVEDIGLTHTTIKRWDWRRYVLPNSKMLSSQFLSYTLRDGWVWAYIEFWVALDADLDEVERLAIEAYGGSAALAETDDPPGFWVLGMEKDAVRCWAAGWAEGPGNAWTLNSDARKALVKGLAAAGIRGHGFHLELSPEALAGHLSHDGEASG